MGEGMNTDGVSAGCEINRLGNGAAVLLLSAITTECHPLSSNFCLISSRRAANRVSGSKKHVGSPMHSVSETEKSNDVEGLTQRANIGHIFVVSGHRQVRYREIPVSDSKQRQTNTGLTFPPGDGVR